jgi:hypothetical protein
MGQGGPVLPTKQEFPPPVQVQKPIQPGQSGPLPAEPDELPNLNRPSTELFELDPEPFELDLKPMESMDPGNVFQPPVPPPSDSGSSFGTPVAPALPSLPAPGLDSRRETRRGTTATTDYNFGIALSEQLLNELASDARQEADSVCDRILGAQVSGTQSTTATTRVDCRRNFKTAQIDFVLQSITNSNTVGRLPNAAVSTAGYHRADLVKSVFFDGKILTTRRPQGFIRANNQNRGVVTPYTGVPLIGPVANQIAQSRTAQSKVASETETASSLARKVIPRFNQSVDERLADANRRMTSDLEPWLRDKGLYPQSVMTTTTDNELRFRAKYGLGAATTIPQRRLSGRKGSILLHDSAVNTLLTDLGLAGMQVTDRQLKRTLAKLSGSSTVAPEVEGELPVEEDLSQPLLYSLILADRDPISVRFVNDGIEVAVRITIKPVAVDTLVPMQVIRLPIQPVANGSQLTINFGEPIVEPADGSEPAAPSRLIQQQIIKLLKPVDVPAGRDFEVSATKRLKVQVSDIGTSNGWLLLAID